MWGEIIGALAGSLLGGKNSQQTTASKSEPWGPAQPWIQANIGSGQALQGKYAQNPFSGLQLDAFNKAHGLGKSFMDTREGLNRQLSNQRQFDRSAPLTRANQFNFDPSQTATGASGSTGAAGGMADLFGGQSFLPSSPFSFTQPGPAAPAAPAGAQEQFSGNDRDPSFSGDGIFGNVNSYSGGINGIMNGPLGIAIGQLANTFGGTQAPAPVSDVHGVSVADIQAAEQAARDAAEQAGLDSVDGFGGLGGFGGYGGGGYGSGSGYS